MNITKMVNEGNFDERLYPVCAAFMDDELREALHEQLAPCTDTDFMLAYCDAHKEKYGEDFYI